MNTRRYPTDQERTLLKSFFADDMINSRLRIEEIDAMVSANEIVMDDNTDIIVYDVNENIKFVVMVTLQKEDDGFFKSVTEYVIDLEINEVRETQQIDIL